MEKFIQSKPQFKDGVILKANKMNELAKHTFELPNLIFTGFTHGIISGLEVSVQNNNIVISKGAFCFESEIYTIIQDMLFPYSPTKNWQYLKIDHVDTLSKLDGIEESFEIKLDNKSTKNDEIELCRFNLQDGAKLRFMYDDFEDMNTEFDTISLIYVPYSSKDNPSLHPKILKNFAREMLNLNPQNILDTFFCLGVLGLNTVMNAEEIHRYIEIRTDEKIDLISNYKLYQKLFDILKEEKSKTKTLKNKLITRRKIIVD